MTRQKKMKITYKRRHCIYGKECNAVTIRTIEEMRDLLKF